jgi:hypothetical protein
VDGLKGALRIAEAVAHGLHSLETELSAVE